MKLPTLAFGQALAQEDLSVYAMQDRLTLLGNGIHIYESLTKPEAFLHKSWFTTINSLTIGTVASTAIRVESKKINTPMLLMPLSGSGSYQIDGKVLNWCASDRAVFMPSESLKGESTTRSTLAVFVDTHRLKATTTSMLGIENQTARLNGLNVAKEVPLQYGRISFDKIFRQLTGLIDEISSKQSLLSLSGVDDGIYRAMAIMLNPDLFKIEMTCAEPKRHQKNLIDIACQYIQAHHDQPITLTELEHMSGMSARTLQLAFQKQFQCTPIQWIRMQRLDTSREYLIKAKSEKTITEIAFICGFNKPSTFAHYYKQRFGELPSQTLTNGLLS